MLGLVSKKKYDDVKKEHKKLLVELNSKLEEINSKDVKIATLEREKEFSNVHVQELSYKYHSLVASNGGFTASNNRLKKENDSLKIENNELEIVNRNNIKELSRYRNLLEDKNKKIKELEEQNKNMTSKITNLQNIMNNLNKKSKKKTTVIDIINYDRKNPIKK